MNDRTLGRDTHARVFAGVCAGVANYFGFAVWLVRVLTVSATLLGGGLVIILGYIGLALLLEPATMPNDEPSTIKSRPWEQGMTPKQLLTRLQNELTATEARIHRIEAHLMDEPSHHD